MGTVNTRCTQCGADNTTEVDDSTVQFGTGRQHGTEWLPCPACSETCSADECTDDAPCERCETTTLQNRRGASVPRSEQ